MNQAIAQIQAEHRGMWQVLNVLEDLAERSGAGGEPERALAASVLAYLETYIDRVHHPKEDEHLFALLAERSEAARDLIDRLHAQHEEGPRRLARLRDSLSPATPAPAESFRDAARDYVHFQREHMREEETALLPLAREYLRKDDWARIEEAFAANDDPLFGEQARAEFASLRAHIAEQAPPPLGLGGRPAGDGRRAAHDGAEAVLELQGVSAHYGQIAALQDVSIQVRKGQIVALVGSNGAGKTTLLRTISGLQRPSAGRIVYGGEDLTRVRPARRVAAGIAHVPEGRQVFAPLSVADNLALGAYSRRDGKAAVRRDLEHVYELFPILRDKRGEPAGTLSGGQQQMLAIGRALMARPRLLLLDEPSMGLAPLLVEEVFAVIERLQGEGITVLVVEQNATAALGLADMAYVLEAGEVTHSGPGTALRDDEQVQRAYLGI